MNQEGYVTHRGPDVTQKPSEQNNSGSIRVTRGVIYRVHCVDNLLLV